MHSTQRSEQGQPADRTSLCPWVRGIRLAGAATIGALLGRAVGGNLRGTLIGGVLGAAAATTISSAVRNENLPLPESGQLLLSLRSRRPAGRAVPT